jgi:cytidine deaminase
MRARRLTRQDEELVSAAVEAIGRNFLKDRHHVGAAVRAGSGRIYVGVHLESPGHDVCAEPVALGSAVTAGERRFGCIVAVHKGDRRGDEAHVLSPCGTCRELLYYYAPEIEVIVPVGPRLAKVRIADLLPVPWTSTHRLHHRRRPKGNRT